ncbi:NACHT domain-containing protein [Nostoc sp. 'Peltigera malacea cyanobiont' DB3992]|uniref:NACHT domain-containing protein n=1 Tax=Nostoc sp. 'Peltigera malacea cyanobiont' DB3992 TaxID=1206980 RepID=UPI000C049CA3|nr:hypothetical protein [Nostoc sp. 'Peltigera malacea cyanobiont' DB3992]PHM08062.1 hypothetical protein CK516_23080 [Nostoc sp. 'Peltigera malacea cyanobiont' DB3992]
MKRLLEALLDFANWEFEDSKFDIKFKWENAFADLFKNNRVWLLLDAADEMSSPQPLTEISQQLTGWVKNARVVLTCRVNVWEANANALENFETYRLLNFEYPKQVQEFIERWWNLMMVSANFIGFKPIFWQPMVLQNLGIVVVLMK